MIARTNSVAIDMTVCLSDSLGVKHVISAIVVVSLFVVFDCLERVIVIVVL